MKSWTVRRTKSRVFKSILAAIFVCLACHSGRADYPIMPQHYAADPTAVEWNGRLYVYCSNDEENGENTGYIMDSIVCFSTDDLKNWTDHGVVFDADELSSWYSGTAWAPCIVYHNNQFYLYFGDAYWGIGVVTSSSPTGPFTAPRNDLVVTRSTPGANSTWLFDPCVFVDDDGTPYMYFGGGGPNQGRIIQLNPNMIEPVGSAITVEASDFFEASLMHKYNGTYYYSYADNYEDSTPSSQIAYQTAPTPTGPFTHRGVAVGQPPYNYGNNNHHTFFTYQGQWYCVYHNRYQATQDGVSTTEHRNIGLDRLYYNPDGTIQPLVHTQDGLPQLKYLNPFERVEGETLAQASGIRTQVCAEGGMNVTAIDNGDWIRIRGVDFGSGAGSFLARTASSKNGVSIEIRLDSLTGTLIGTCPVPNTGDPQNWTTTFCNVTGASGVHDLYLKFVGPTEGDLMNLNWWQFQTQSLTTTSVTLDPSILYQTMEGLGGAICFYNGWITTHPYKSEIYNHAFSGLNLSLLRLGNWWRGTDGQDTSTYEIVSAANQRLGRPVPVCISSWSPPAYLKSNGQTGGGGTLIQIDGQYDYAGFAEYWYQSLQDYIARGVVPSWITIQNEPDWTADYDSCRFDPTEATYASYALAQDAVYNRLQSMASPPKLLSPDCVGLYGNAAALRNYLNNLNSSTFYGIAHHLYGGSTDGTPDGYNSAFTTVLNTRNSQFPGKPIFMTEFGDIKGLIPCANLIHNCLVVEHVSGYSHWSLIWPGDIGLVQIEFPWSYYGAGGEWTTPKGYWLNPSYWSMKHYSYYVQPGFRRARALSGNADVLASAFLAPDGKRLVTVLINRLESQTVYTTLNVGSFAYDSSSVFQTAGDQYFQPLGPLMGSQVILPPSSITTIVLDCYGPAAPTGLAATAIIDSQINLTWAASPGALSYNIKRSTVSGGPYSLIGTKITGTAFSDTTVAPGTTYYYVVSANALSGESADSAEVSASRVRTYLKFNETTGTTAVDATGGGRNGTLVNGPTWGAGKYANAVYLDGSNDYVSLPSGVVNGLTECTLSMWVYLNTISTWSRVFDFGTGTSVNMFLTPRHSNASGTVRFAITTGGAGGEQRINGTSALPTGAWTHVAITLGGGTGVLYVNGVEVGRNSSMTLNPSSLGNTTQNYIGRSQYSADPYLNGRIDEFRIYSKALTAAEIARLYEEQIPPAAPSVPTGLNATAVSGSRIDLTWNASDGTTNYDIKRSLINGGPYTTITSVSSTAYSDTELVEKTTYYYVVSAVNSVGASVNSSQTQAVTLADPPAAPTGLAADDTGGAVLLTWNASTESDLAGYHIYRSTTPASGYTRLNTSLLNTPTFTDTDIAFYTTYYYVVTAVDTDGYESDYSLETSITPADPRAIILTAVDFEDGFGEWVNLTGENLYDWLRNTGSTLTPNTGPAGGAENTNWYAYLETSPGYANMTGDAAILESPLFGGSHRRLTFFYHMYGVEIGSLFVDVFDGTWHNGIWSRTGQQHTSSAEPYSQAIVDLSGFTGPLQIRLRAVAVGGPRGDIAIDQIVVTGRFLYGDINGDGAVDIDDLTDFADLWLQDHCLFDLNSDCRIELYEWAEFAANWLVSDSD